MLDYTKAAFSKIINDFRKIFNGIKIATQLLSILYLIFALCTGTGIMIANIVLLVLSLGYFVFFLIMETKKGKRKVKRLIKSIYGWSKRSIKLLTIGITIYGLVLAKADFEPLSFLVVVLMVIGWVLEFLFYIIIKFLEAEKNLLIEGLVTDLGSVPILGNYVKKLENNQAPIPEKTRLKLDGMVQEAREKKALQKQQAKIEKKENAKLAKAQKAEEKRQLKAAKKTPQPEAPAEEEPQKKKRKK